MLRYQKQRTEQRDVHLSLSNVRETNKREYVAGPGTASPGVDYGFFKTR